MTTAAQAQSVSCRCTQAHGAGTRSWGSLHGPRTPHLPLAGDKGSGAMPREEEEDGEEAGAVCPGKVTATQH